ncbi:MAG: molybdopterin-dependent oxidoreductase [Sulfolobales archaeon]
MNSEVMKTRRRDFIKLSAASTIAALTMLSIQPHSVVSKMLAKQLLLEEASKTPLEGLRFVKTFCGMCVACCGIQVGVDGNGRPRVVLPITKHAQRGLCGRSASSVWLWNNPLRLKKPMANERKGEAMFKEVSWDHALDGIASKLREIVNKYGYRAIAIAFHDVWSYYMPLFSYLFGTPNTVSVLGTCAGNGNIARAHVLGAGPPFSVDPDYENASFILFIGRALSAASMGAANRAMTNEGLEIVIVDPRMPEMAFGNARWVPITPGTDAAFALSIIHVLLEEGLYDEGFLKKYSNAPFLIKPDGKPLTEADIVEGGDPKKYLVFDAKEKKPVDHRAALDPDLWYVGEVTLKDGSKITVKTALTLLKERASNYKPEIAEKITGIKAEDIRWIARKLALRNGVVDDTWWAAKSGNDYNDIRAFLIINALLGNIDRPGGLCYQEPSRFPSIISVKTVEGKRVAETIYGAAMPEELFGDVDRPRVDRAKYPLTPSTSDAVLDAILEEKPYPIKALFVMGTSMIMRDMNTKKVIEALKKLDLLVVIDVLPIDDIDYADYVLPDTIFLERDEITFTKWTLHASVQKQSKVVDPPKGVDARDALWIMFEIARRAFPERAKALGWDDKYADYEAYRREFLPKLEKAIISRLAAAWNIDVEKLREALDNEGYYLLKKKEYYVRPYKTSIPTPSGKVEIYSLAALAAGLDPLPDYKPPSYALPKAPDEFYLVSGKGPLTSVHACMLEPMKFIEDRSVWMNPKDAERLGISDGDIVELEGIETGWKARVRVKVTERVREGVLFAYANMWGRISKFLPEDHFVKEGVNPNWFVKDRVTPIVGGGVGNSSVRVRKL